MFDGLIQHTRDILGRKCVVDCFGCKIDAHIGSLIMSEREIQADLKAEIEKQKKQRELQARKWRREVEEQQQVEFENQKQREKQEIEEDKVARRHREKELRL